MVPILVAAHTAFIGAANAGPPESRLLRMEQALELGRADIPAMTPVVDDAAARLAGGGKLWAAGQRSMISELCSRAGGLMLIQDLVDKTPDKGDVVLYSQEGTEPPPDGIRTSGALTVVFGGKQTDPGARTFLNHGQEAGISPTLSNAIPGWLFTGELIAALTRLGKMPVIFASVGIYNGYPRIYEYQMKGIFWHEKHSVPSVAPGVIANKYCDLVGAMLLRVEGEERDRLDQAGAWAAEAKLDGKRLIMYSMGHLFPAEIETTDIGKLFESAVWNSGFFHVGVPNDTYSPGDVLIHIGYQHPPYRLLDRARPAGAKVAYVDVMQHRDYVHDPDVIWIDPMWPWVDGCVPLENYDVPLLASSGIVNGAIAWDIYRVTQEKIAGAGAGAR